MTIRVLGVVAAALLTTAVGAGPVPSSAAIPAKDIQIPAAGARTGMPLHILARVGRPGEAVIALLRWQNGTYLWFTFHTLRGPDGRGLLVGSLDNRTLIPGVPPPKTQAATLELRTRTGRVLARQRVTILQPSDPATQALTVYWVKSDQLVPMTVYVPRTPRIATAALTELLWGPPAGSAPSLTTALPLPQQVISYLGRRSDWGLRVTLRRLTIVHGVATADFSQELRAYGGGSARVRLIRAQITRTLLQFPSIHTVQIAIEGQTSGVLEP